jgi:hypothetical protein
MKARVTVSSLKTIATPFEWIKESDTVEVTGLYADSFLLYTSFRLETGLLLSMKTEILLQGQKHSFPITALIVKSQEQGDIFCSEVKLRQYDKELWLQLRQDIDGTQKRIDRLFESMKG